MECGFNEHGEGALSAAVGETVGELLTSALAASPRAFSSGLRGRGATMLSLGFPAAILAPRIRTNGMIEAAWERLGNAMVCNTFQPTVRRVVGTLPSQHCAARDPLSLQPPGRKTVTTYTLIYAWTGLL